MRTGTRGGTGSRLLLGILMIMSFSACSVYMAAKQPEEKNLDVLVPGTSRAAIIAELGPPLHSTTNPTSTVDIYKFHEGSSKEAKMGRAAFHAAADVFTLGLWEIVGTPTEIGIKGDPITVEVTFGPDGTLVSSSRTVVSSSEAPSPTPDEDMEY